MSIRRSSTPTERCEASESAASSFASSEEDNNHDDGENDDDEEEDDDENDPKASSNRSNARPELEARRRRLRALYRELQTLSF